MMRRQMGEEECDELGSLRREERGRMIAVSITAREAAIKAIADPVRSHERSRRIDISADVTRLRTHGCADGRGMVFGLGETAEVISLIGVSSLPFAWSETDGLVACVALALA